MNNGKTCLKDFASEAFTPECLENREDIYFLYYMHFDIFSDVSSNS